MASKRPINTAISPLGARFLEREDLRMFFGIK
jgi:hypothetical protein